MIDAILDNIYPILGAVLLACFVSFLSFRRFIKQRKIEASDKFRDTILTELSDLYPEGIFNMKAGSEVTKILREKHNVINTAIINYRRYIWNKKGFDKAWDNFTGIDRFRERNEKPRYNQYAFEGRNNHFYANPREMFVKNIKQLLKFTE